eukprot:GHVP01054718.1.p1 GENE.GHVP01054718.1~~GHVP01054718.1.p1  ORF type:complete len:364 (+),score=53.81 GHVP01054718.1:680-1771(+)
MSMDMDTYERSLHETHATSFHLLAQERILDSLHDTVRGNAQDLKEKFPAAATGIKIAEEIYWVLISALEIRSLATKGSTLAENLCGLRRVPAELAEFDLFKSGLPGKNIALEMLVSYVVPWVKNSFLMVLNENPNYDDGDRSYLIQFLYDLLPATIHKIRIRFRDFIRRLLQPASRHSDSRRKFIIKMIPTINWIQNWLQTMSQCLYLADRRKWPYWKLSLWFQGLVLTKKNTNQTSEEESGYSIKSIFVHALQISLIIVVVSDRFARWWRHLRTQNVQTKSPPPPPPEPQNISIPNFKRVELPQNSALCPLCKSIRRKSCCSNGGYAFCFNCLLPYVRLHGRCPVSGIPTKEATVRIFYEST